MLGISRSTHSNWKLVKNKSYLKHIDEIADFLDMSPSYLLREVEDGSSKGIKAAVECEMLRVLRNLSQKKQECLIQVVWILLSEGLESEYEGRMWVLLRKRQKAHTLS